LRIHESLMERALMSPLGYQFLLHLAPRIDKALIPPTNGRLSSIGIGRVGLVTTTGAKSGLQRTHPLTLMKDSDGLLAIGSAHPECAVEFMAPTAQYRAELLSGDARASAWATATDFYAGYERYRAICAPREIRVFRLRPVV
jgi:deazaflavin-dependent oxidoreductase (nitroreductase family)